MRAHLTTLSLFAAITTGCPPKTAPVEPDESVAPDERPPLAPNSVSMNNFLHKMSGTFGTGWEASPMRSDDIIPGTVWMEYKGKHLMWLRDCSEADVDWAAFADEINFNTEADASLRVSGVQVGVRVSSDVRYLLNFSETRRGYILGADQKLNEECISEIKTAVENGVDFDSLYYISQSLSTKLSYAFGWAVDAQGRSLPVKVEGYLENDINYVSSDPIIIAIQRRPLRDVLTKSQKGEIAPGGVPLYTNPEDEWLRYEGGGRYLVNNNTVLDLVMKRVWSKGHPSGQVPLFEADNYCNNSTLSGKTGWFLPNQARLGDFLNAEQGEKLLRDVLGLPSGGTYWVAESYRKTQAVEGDYWGYDYNQVEYSYRNNISLFRMTKWATQEEYRSWAKKRRGVICMHKL